MRGKKENLLSLVTPGEILREEFLVPLGITPCAERLKDA